MFFHGLLYLWSSFFYCIFLHSDVESHLLLELCDGFEDIDMTRKRKWYGSASSPKTKTQVNVVDLSDDSDSDDSEEGDIS